MKKVHSQKVLSFFGSFVVLMFCCFVLTACGSPDPVNSPDGGQEDGGQIATDGGVNDGGNIDAGCCHPDGGQGTDGGPAYDGGTDGGDPLAEYMWIQGSWQETLYCATVQEDGGMSNCQNRGRQPVSVTVESWDDAHGAVIRGFNPMGTLYVRINNETGSFEIYVEYPSGNKAEGSGNKNTLVIELEYFTKIDGGWIITYYKFEKQS